MRLEPMLFRGRALCVTGEERGVPHEIPVEPEREPVSCSWIALGNCHSEIRRGPSHQDIEPPDSNYPRLENQTLVSLAGFREAFPSIPSMAPPSVMNTVDVLNFGPDFGPQGGIEAVLPPIHGRRYTALVPRPDADGTGMAGIKTMWSRAPIGTNVGWNVRAGFRAPDLCSLSGSFIPFAKTKAERLANGDSRRSLEERYQSHAGFVRAVTKAANELVKERFLLQEDANAFIDAAQTSDVLR